jgi:hypothetical protein
MPTDTPFEIGQVWELDYEPVPPVQPPHVEDVRVDPNTARYVDTIEPLVGATVSCERACGWGSSVVAHRRGLCGALAC